VKPAPAAKPVAAPAPTTIAKAKTPDDPSARASAVEATAALSGRIELVAGAGQSMAAADMAGAVVYFVPDAAGARAKPGRFTIYTHNKQFEPESLVIPLGSTITFPNQDEILHNVFSVTPASSFDLGLYGEGKSAEYTFKKPGLVLINCNVHHAMQANVLVVDTAFIARPDAAGRFDLGSLPAGPGKLMLWHPRAALQTEPVSLPVAGPLALKLVLNKPRITEHLNKERKPYAPAR
jgi:plastocyanin